MAIPWSDGSGQLDHWWMKPAKQGKCLLLGPLQFNWYDGFRVHLTWPTHHTLNVWTRRG